ncbi:MAG TPA: ATP-binding protein [Longimicrobiales bacterium]
MSVATQTTPGAAELRELNARFRDSIARIPPALRAPLAAYADALAEIVAEAHRASIASLRALEAGHARAPLDDGRRRQELLRALDEARHAYADAVLGILDGEAIRATDGRAEAMVAGVLEALESVPAPFPPVLRVPQTAAHFEPAPQDPLRLRALKAGKRALRRIRKDWPRAIPVHDLARYHAALFEVEAAAPLAELRRLRVLAVSAAYRLFRTTAQVLDDVRGSAFVAAVAGRGAMPSEVMTDHRQQLDALAEALGEAIRRDARAIEAGIDAAVRRVADAFADALETAGTVALPTRTVSFGRARRIRDRARTGREDTFAAWERYERTLAESLAAEAEVARAAAVARTAAARAAVAVHEAVELQLHAPLLSLRDAVREVDRDAETALAADREPAASLEALDRAIQNAFARGAELADEGDALWNDVARPILTLRDELARAPHDVQPSRAIAPLPLDHVPAMPPKSGARTAPVRRLVEVHLAGRLRRELDALLERARPELEEARAEVRRLRQAAAYNVAAALRGAGHTAAGEAAPAARELVGGVLDRAAARLDALVHVTTAFEQEIAAALRERVDAATAAMIDAVRTRDALEIHERVLLETTRKRVDTSLVSGRRALAATARATRAAAIALQARAGRIAARLRHRLGIADVEKAEVLTSLDQSLLDSRITAALPVIYRQLFALDPLEWDDFLVGRDRDLETIRSAYARWLDGHAAALAIHGEKGSGKTTLLNAALRDIFDDGPPVATIRPTRHERTEAALAGRLAQTLGLPPVTSLDALAAAFDAGHRRVIIVEDAQNLFLRAIGGFDLMRAFLALVAATNRSAFWVVTMDQYAWRYLAPTLGIPDHFAFEIDTTTLEREAIEQAILARHTVSGYALRFEPDDKLRASRRWRRLPSERARQAAARRHFFDQLARIAEGNIFVALFYWLRSIRAVEEHTLVFGSPRVIDVRFLEHLPLDTLHTIAAIIQHGSLSAAEHAAVFQRDPAESRLHLLALADAYLIFPDDDGQYVVNKVLYRPFVRLLKAKNVF